jgi:hypothetical protein
MPKSYDEWVKIGLTRKTQEIIHDREELCRLIMGAAIDKVERLGFTMAVGKNTCPNSSRCEKYPLKPRFIVYRNPDKS